MEWEKNLAGLPKLWKRGILSSTRGCERKANSLQNRDANFGPPLLSRISKKLKTLCKEIAPRKASKVLQQKNYIDDGTHVSTFFIASII